MAHAGRMLALATIVALPACSSKTNGAVPLDTAGDAGADVEGADAGEPAEGGPTECARYAAGAAPLREGAIFALSKVYIDRDRATGAPSADAWKKYGFDLDGLATAASSTNHCQPVAGADAARVKTDGDNGIDNAFGASIAPIIASFDQPNQPGWVQTWNTSLQLDPDLVLRFPAQEAASYPAQVYASAPLCKDSSARTPKLFPIDAATVEGNDVDRPKAPPITGTLAGDVWTSDVIASLAIVIPVAGGPIPMRLQRVRMSMRLSADRKSVTDGVIGGIANTEELVAALRQFKGFINPLACVPGVFDQYEAKIRQASDILDDGTQDPQRTCNGITVGIGFDMVRASIGSVEMPPPKVDPCAK
jgi:hypothetical protein